MPPFPCEGNHQRQHNLLVHIVVFVQDKIGDMLRKRFYDKWADKK